MPWVHKATFASASETNRGTAGVGVIEGPGSQVWDFSVRRRVPITEKFKLQFQADIFNAFNRTNFRDLDVNLANASFGTLIASGPARSIQFGLKLTS